MKSFKENKIIINLVSIVFLIALIIGLLMIRYFWGILNKVRTVNRQQIEASVTHFEKDLIKTVYKRIEEKIKINP